jgi:hypothetical protein
MNSTSQIPIHLDMQLDHATVMTMLMTLTRPLHVLQTVIVFIVLQEAKLIAPTLGQMDQPL